VGLNKLEFLALTSLSNVTLNLWAILQVLEKIKSCEYGAKTLSKTIKNSTISKVTFDTVKLSVVY
jgi:hypothetical protein